MEDEEAPCDGVQDVALAVLALHPLSYFVVEAVGSQLRIFSLRDKCPVSSKPQFDHLDSIRAISFSRGGQLFVSAGDDKLVKLWDAESWQCIKTTHANKKVSAVSFSHDGEWLMYADKFGVVYFVSTKANEDLLTSSNQPIQALAHCCSTITSLRCSADGRFIVTADRDFKIRISVFPKSPLKGAHEIQGFCLGHTSFVSSLAIVGEVGTKQLLVSGGGDGTVRLWEIESAKLLDTFHTAEVGSEDDASDRLAITCISASFDGSLIAVGVESLNGVLFLKCDLESNSLEFLQKRVLAEHFCPTSIQFDGNGWLWLVAGAATQKVGAFDQNSITWIKVVSPSLVGDVFVCDNVDGEYLPGGTLLLETLACTDSVDDANKSLALAEATKMALKNQLCKRRYTPGHIESRKRLRNDRKLRKGDLNAECV